MKFLLPQGIGDSIWAMTKVQSIAKVLGDGKVEIFLNTWNRDETENRAIPFIRRFSFVEKVGQVVTGIVLNPENPTDAEGKFQYIPDGIKMDGIDYTLMPNAPLERGIRLEEWLPQFDINWEIMKDFMFTVGELEIAGRIRAEGQFCVFFLGSEMGNTVDGHNRGPVWRPEDWIKLGNSIQGQLGLKIVVVGAPYDLPYWENHFRMLQWKNLIGTCGIAQTYAVIREARFVVSYQSGIGIVASYLGIPTAIFWRARGDSISPSVYISFEESMSSAWVDPKMIEAGKHLPLIYGKHDANYVVSEIVRRNW